MEKKQSRRKIGDRGVSPGLDENRPVWTLPILGDQGKRRDNIVKLGNDPFHIFKLPLTGREIFGNLYGPLGLNGLASSISIIGISSLIS